MLETSRIGMASVKCEKSMSGILNRGKLVNISGELMNIETHLTYIFHLFLFFISFLNNKIIARIK